MLRDLSYGVHFCKNKFWLYTYICVYIPQAGRPTEEKEKVYKELEQQMRKYKSKRPIYVLGDLNARVQKATSRAEKEK